MPLHAIALLYSIFSFNCFIAYIFALVIFLQLSYIFLFNIFQLILKYIIKGCLVTVIFFLVFFFSQSIITYKYNRNILFNFLFLFLRFFFFLLPSFFSSLSVFLACLLIFFVIYIYRIFYLFKQN